MKRVSLIIFVGTILIVLVSLLFSASSVVDRINSARDTRMEIINKLN